MHYHCQMAFLQLRIINSKPSFNEVESKDNESNVRIKIKRIQTNKVLCFCQLQNYYYYYYFLPLAGSNSDGRCVCPAAGLRQAVVKLANLVASFSLPVCPDLQGFPLASSALLGSGRRAN